MKSVIFDPEKSYSYQFYLEKGYFPKHDQREIEKFIQKMKEKKEEQLIINLFGNKKNL